MEDTLLVLLDGEAKAAQRFEGKEAAFMTELLTRQGEVQDECKDFSEMFDSEKDEENQ